MIVRSRSKKAAARRGVGDVDVSRPPTGVVSTGGSRRHGREPTGCAVAESGVRSRWWCRSSPRSTRRDPRSRGAPSERDTPRRNRAEHVEVGPAPARRSFGSFAALSHSVASRRAATAAASGLRMCSSRSSPSAARGASSASISSRYDPTTAPSSIGKASASRGRSPGCRSYPRRWV